MELSSFDLEIIKHALVFLKQREPDVESKEYIESTIKTVTDIMREYPNASVFEVKPNKLEE